MTNKFVTIGTPYAIKRQTLLLLLMKRLILSALVVATPLLAFAGSYSFSTTGVNSLSHGEAAVWGLYDGNSNNPATTTGKYKSLLTELGGANTVITGATLKLFDPSDWKSEPKDVLYVNILKGLDISSGVDKHTYNSNPSQYDSAYGPNAFDDASGWRNNNAHTGLMFDDSQPGSLLKSTNADMPADLPGTWTDTAGPYGQNKGNSDVTITFTAANLALLEQYLRADIAENLVGGNNWSVGLGFAAECHYYFDCVQLDITIGTIPPPPPPPTNVPDSGSTVALMAVALAGLAGLRRRFVK